MPSRDMRRVNVEEMCQPRKTMQRSVVSQVKSIFVIVNAIFLIGHRKAGNEMSTTLREEFT